MREKILIIFMMLLFITSFSIVSFAENQTEQISNERIEDFNGDMTVEEGAALLPTLTYEDQLLLMEKERILQKEMMDLNSLSNLRAITALGVPKFIQEYSYWCGPATTKEVLHYLNGNSLTQSGYATALGTTTAGTDFTRVASVLNNNLSNSFYAYSSIGNQSLWFSRIQTDINKGYPIVLDIDASNVGEIPYSSSGHILPVCGYNNGGTPPVLVVDPWTSVMSSEWYPATVMYTANNNHWRAAMVW